MDKRNELADALIAKKKKTKFKLDGKEYNLSDFDDTKSWSRAKKK